MQMHTHWYYATRGMDTYASTYTYTTSDVHMLCRRSTMHGTADTTGQRPSQLLYICNGIFAILERKNNMATQGSHLRCSTGEEASRAASVRANHMSAAASSGPGHAHDTPIEN